MHPSRLPPTRLLRAVEVLVLICLDKKKKKTEQIRLKSKDELVNHTFVPLQATNNMQVPKIQVKSIVEQVKFNSLFLISQ